MQDFDSSHPSRSTGAWFKSRWGVALIGFAAIGALLLIYEHRFHIPFGNAFVLLSLFGLHMLMHSGHGHGGGHGHSGHNHRTGPAESESVVPPSPDSKADEGVGT